MNYSKWALHLNNIILWGTLLLGTVLILLRSDNWKSIATRMIILIAFIVSISAHSLIYNIDHLLFPRENINTYLYQNPYGENAHFIIDILDSNGVFLGSYSQKDEIAVKIYEALKQSQIIEHSSMTPFTFDYQIGILQDHKDERFQGLIFAVGKQYKKIRVFFQNQAYDFETSPQFQQLFASLIKETRGQK